MSPLPMDTGSTCNIVLMARDIDNIKDETDAYVYLMEIILPSLLLLPEYIVGVELRDLFRFVLSFTRPFRPYHFFRRIKKAATAASSFCTEVTTGAVQCVNTVAQITPFANVAIFGAKIIFGISYFVYLIQHEKTQQRQVFDNIMDMTKTMTDEWIREVDAYTLRARTVFDEHCRENPDLEKCELRKSAFEEVEKMKTVYKDQINLLLQKSRDPTTKKYLTLQEVFRKLNETQNMIYEVLGILEMIASGVTDEELETIIDSELEEDLEFFDAVPHYGNDDFNGLDPDPNTLQTGGKKILSKLFGVVKKSVGQFIGNKIMKRDEYAYNLSMFQCEFNTFLNMVSKTERKEECSNSRFTMHRKLTDIPNLETQREIANIFARIFSLLKIRFGQCGINQIQVVDAPQADGTDIEYELNATPGQTCSYYKRRVVREIENLANKISEMICLWKEDIKMRPIYSSDHISAVHLARQYMTNLDTVFNPQFNPLDSTKPEDHKERSLLLNLKFMEFCAKIATIDLLVTFAETSRNLPKLTEKAFLEKQQYPKRRSRYRRTSSRRRRTRTRRSKSKRS